MSNARKKLEQLLTQGREVESGEGCSEEVIRDAEESLGLRIQGSYRSFLRKYGWLCVGSFEFYGIEGPPDHLELVKMTRLARKDLELPSFLLPFLDDGAGSLMCLDTRQSPEPPVVFWDHESGEDQDLDEESNSFAEWVLEELEDLSAS